MADDGETKTNADDEVCDGVNIIFVGYNANDSSGDTAGGVADDADDCDDDADGCDDDADDGVVGVVDAAADAARGIDMKSHCRTANALVDVTTAATLARQRVSLNLARLDALASRIFEQTNACSTSVLSSRRCTLTVEVERLLVLMLLMLLLVESGRGPSGVVVAVAAVIARCRSELARRLVRYRKLDSPGNAGCVVATSQSASRVNHVNADIFRVMTMTTTIQPAWFNDNDDYDTTTIRRRRLRQRTASVVYRLRNNQAT